MVEMCSKNSSLEYQYTIADSSELLVNSKEKNSDDRYRLILDDIVQPTQNGYIFNPEISIITKMITPKDFCSFTFTIAGESGSYESSFRLQHVISRKDFDVV